MCPKYQERYQIKRVKLSFYKSFFIILTSIHSFMSFLPLYISFHLDSLHHHLDSPYFFAFPPRFPRFPHWFPAPAFPSHSSYSHPYSLDFSHSFTQFPILVFIGSLLGLLSLRIYFRKTVALVQKRTLHFVTTANPRHQIIVYIIYDVISVITKNYSASSKKSIICEVWANNSEWLKCYLRLMSKGGTTCPEL